MDDLLVAADVRRWPPTELTGLREKPMQLFCVIHAICGYPH